MLARTIGTHPLENYSHEMANYLNKVVSIFVTSLLVLEMIFYNIYATKVKTHTHAGSSISIYAKYQLVA